MFPFTSSNFKIFIRCLRGPGSCSIAFDDGIIVAVITIRSRARSLYTRNVITRLIFTFLGGKGTEARRS